VVWRVVNSCNLACPFCAFDKRLDFTRSDANPAEVIRFAGLLADYQARTNDPVLLSWLGGEPLLWAPLEELTRAARALRLEVSTTTNGTSLGSARVAQHLCDHYKELTISLDGFSDFHDAMRGWTGGFDKLSDWVPALARRIHDQGSPLRLRANIVLMRRNVKNFPALCRELARWGISEISFNQLGGRDRPEFYQAHRLTIADVHRLAAQLPEIRRHLADFGAILVGGENYLKRILASARNERNPVRDCGPGENFLFIDEKGRVSPCSFTSQDYGIDSRAIHTPTALAALSSRFRTMQLSRRSTQCDDCLSTQVCDKFKWIQSDEQEPILA
jgi:radical SAM protein with 4Fe4S-binding SPASM domain